MRAPPGSIKSVVPYGIDPWHAGHMGRLRSSADNALRQSIEQNFWPVEAWVKKFLRAAITVPQYGHFSLVSKASLTSAPSRHSSEHHAGQGASRAWPMRLLQPLQMMAVMAWRRVWVPGLYVRRIGLDRD